MLRYKLFEDFFDNIEEPLDIIDIPIDKPIFSSDDFNYTLWIGFSNLKFIDVESFEMKIEQFNTRLQMAIKSMCKEIKMFSPQFMYDLSINDYSIIQQNKIDYKTILNDGYSELKISTVKFPQRKSNIMDIYFWFDINRISKMYHVQSFIKSLYMISMNIAQLVFSKNTSVMYMHLFNKSIKDMSVELGLTEIIHICKKRDMTPGKRNKFRSLCKLMMEKTLVPKIEDVRNFFKDTVYTNDDIYLMKMFQVYDNDKLKKTKDEQGIIHVTIPENTSYTLSTVYYYFLYKSRDNKLDIKFHVHGKMSVNVNYVDQFDVLFKILEPDDLKDLKFIITPQFICESHKHKELIYDIRYLEPEKLTIEFANGENIYMKMIKDHNYKFPEFIISENTQYKIINKTELSCNTIY